MTDKLCKNCKWWAMFYWMNVSRVKTKALEYKTLKGSVKL